jgi:ABC-type branched-subunit amino acid transport system ATPase component
MAKENIISISNLSKNFGGVNAVNDMSFGVPQGAIKAVIGPNGAGKSTLFNLITGIEVPTTGEIRFKDQELNSMKPHQRAAIGLSRTFQTPQIFGNLTVLENILIGRHLHGRSGMIGGLLSTSRARRENREMKEYGLELLERIGLVDKTDELAENLGFGQLKLLEIGRALASEPKLMLLDEFAAGLNQNEADKIVALVQDVRDEGVTMLIVEHHMRLVMNMSDEIVVMNFGEKIAEGTPNQIQQNQTVIDCYLGSEDCDA